MLQFVVLVSVSVAVVSASYHEGGHGYGHSVPAAVISKHHVSHYDVHSSGYIKPTTIDVPPNVIPVNFIFRSASSPVYVQQKHVGAPGSYKVSHSQDEPHKLLHTVTKPIYQEVREIISPYRKITQTVEPVHEQVQTVVAKKAYGHHDYHGYGHGGDGGGSGGGGSSGVSGGYGHGGYGHGGYGHSAYGGHQQHY